MPINLSTLAPATTAATSLSNLILVTPQKVVGYQPQPAPSTSLTGPVQSPPKFLFNYEGEQAVSLESDITDHFIEDNTAIQDQIALKPEIITTHGFIAELNDIAPPALELLKEAADKLTTIGAYVPQLSATALIAYSEALLLYQTAALAANSAIAAWSSVIGQNQQAVIGSNGIVESAFTAPQNKQQIAFQTLYGYWRNRILFTVQTPWAVFQNMAILKLHPVQDAETRMLTDFDITFKMIRTTHSIQAMPPTKAGQASTQSDPLTNTGTTTPAPAEPLGDGIAQQEASP